MSTSCLTVFKNESDQEIAVLYRHCDGYPKVHGRELAECLAGFKSVDGFSIDDTKDKKCANGVGCLTAQVVAYFKKGVGNFYLEPAGTRDIGEDYIYTVYLAPDGFRPAIRVERVGVSAEMVGEVSETLFDGLANSYREILRKSTTSNIAS